MIENLHSWVDIYKSVNQVKIKKAEKLEGMVVKDIK